MFLRRFVPLLVLLTSAAAAGPSSRLPVASTNKVVTAPAFVAKDTPSSLASSVVTMPRGGGIDAGVYVKAVQYLYYFYGIGCFASPGTMVTAHFDQPEPEASTKFWIRGASVPIMATAYLLGLLDTDVAVKVAAVTTLLTGIVYPWNAKLGYFTGIDMKCKKIHMFPEISFLVLTILGALAVTGGGSVADAI